MSLNTAINKPADLQAHAFTQGTDVHLTSAQEKHLPHEAWHVVQQKQGRVKETLQYRCITGGNNIGNVIQRQYFSNEILSNYEEAKDLWAEAHTNVMAFDEELDITNVSNIQTLKKNMRTKSTSAAGTHAGEAFETRSWGLVDDSKNVVRGPGKSVGADLRTFSWRRNKWQNAKAGEIKSARTFTTFKQGILKAYQSDPGQKIIMYYDDEIKEFTMNSGGRNYEFTKDDPGHASSEVEIYGRMNDYNVETSYITDAGRATKIRRMR